MPNGTRFAILALIILVATLSLVTIASVPASADQPLVRSTLLQMNVGDSLVVQSNGLTIQQVFLQGNLSAITFQKPLQYPTSELQVNSTEPSQYEMQVMFNRTSDYTVNLYVRRSSTGSIENGTNYYVSGGSFELDITANVNPAEPQIAFSSSAPTWNGFSDWMGKFGQAFPLWVKALYFLFGLQFMVVGGLWIKRETARKDAATQSMDTGDKAYLWLDVVYKYLLTAFVAIVAIMGGELILLFVLRFMFLVSLNLLSLWDLFVVGFAAGAVIIAYFIRFILEKAFDLKPLEDL